MPRSRNAEIISGRLQQLLFSPKGMIEGLLISTKAGILQVSMKPEETDAATLHKALGRSIEVDAHPDESPKTRHGAHPVYKLRSIRKLGGKAVSLQVAAGPVNGIVSMIHYARHGEPNGVILESGEFIHTRPPGMKKLKLRIGSEVTAIGEMRVTALGTPLVEAREVNRVRLE